MSAATTKDLAKDLGSDRPKEPALKDVSASTDADTTETPPKKKGGKRTVVLGIVGLIAVAGGGYALSRRGLESTDDAQVDAEMVALAPRSGGVVIKVSFVDNQQVKAGQVLAEIDPEPARAKLAQAEASLQAAEAAAAAADFDASLSSTNAKASNRAASASMNAASAGAVASRDQIGEARARVTVAETNLAQAKTDFERVDKLFATGALSQAQRDQAKTTLDNATAQVALSKANVSTLESSAAQAASRVQEASAKVEGTKDVDSIISISQARARGAHAQVAQLTAARDLAKLELSYTTIIAPQDGVVSKKSIAVGQTVSAGSPIAQLVPNKAMWITANFKETQIGHMHPGQPVDIEIDTFHGTKIHGTVDSISGATGARFALLPPDNATGNFTKVTQRVPVRVRFDDVPSSVALRPGLSADITVDTRK